MADLLPKTRHQPRATILDYFGHIDLKKRNPFGFMKPQLGIGYEIEPKRCALKGQG
jgi:hypothetical protein